MRAYSDEQCVVALGLLGLRLWRVPMAKDWQAHGCRPCHHVIFKRWGTWDDFLEACGLPAIPADGPHWQHSGRRPYWTDDRVREAILRIEREVGFPRDPKGFDRMTSGRPSWPTSERVRRYGGPGRGAWKRALQRAGLQGLSSSYTSWAEDDDEFLLDNAGHLTLKQIAVRLGRSWQACKRHLYDLGTRARDARGYYTAQVLAQEYQIPLSRVYAALRDGRLRGSRPPGRPYWQIDPDSVEKNKSWLLAAKRTHKGTPPETMDWYRKNGIRRNGAGKIVRKRAAA